MNVVFEETNMYFHVWCFNS